MGLTGQFQTKTFNGGRTNLKVDGDITLTGELNKGRLAQIDAIAAEVNKLRRLSEVFADPGYIWNLATYPWVAGTTPQSITSGKGVVIAGGPTAFVARSLDYGQTWALIDTGSGGAPIYSCTFLDDGSAHGVFLCTPGTAGVYRSTDGGATWAQVLNVAGHQLIINSANGIAVANDLGNSKQSISTDFGATWSAWSAALAHLANSGNAIVYGKGIYVQCCSDGHITYSTTGMVSWNDAGAVFSSSGASATFLDGIFICGGETAIPNAATSRSTDGINWSAALTTLAGNNSTRALCGGNKTIVAGCFGTTNGLYISKDYAQTWTSVPTPNTTPFVAITFINNTFISNYTAWSTHFSYGKSYLYVPRFTNFGTCTNVQFWWQRKPGSNKITINGKFTQGNGNAATGEIGLPIGLIADSSLFSGTIGLGSFYNSAVSDSVFSLLVTAGNSWFGYGINAGGLAYENGNNWANGTVISLIVEIDISGWN